MNKNKNYPITGTFIDEVSYDIPSSNWSKKQWQDDFDNMQEVGINTLVIIRSSLYNRCLYKSKHFPSLKEEGEDFIAFVLNEAKKRHMKVFVGLYMSNIDWNKGDSVNELKLNKTFIDEAYARYHKYSSFVGWYISHEVSSNEFNIIPLFNGLTKYMKKVDRNKKILISPFYKAKGVYPDGSFLTPKEFTKEWQEMLKNCGKDIDYAAFQDGSAPLEYYEEYLKAAKNICDKFNIELWANVETFERDVRHLYFPISFEVLRERIRIANKYVKKLITFEFSHFLSPQSIFVSAHNLNHLYKNYYGHKKA